MHSTGCNAIKGLRYQICWSFQFVSEPHQRCVLQVLIDVNWRPVFFDNKQDARQIILPYVQKADILKMSDEEAEFLYDVPRDEALKNPSKVRQILRAAAGIVDYSVAIRTSCCHCLATAGSSSYPDHWWSNCIRWPGTPLIGMHFPAYLLIGIVCCMFINTFVAAGLRVSKRG